MHRPGPISATGWTHTRASICSPPPAGCTVYPPTPVPSSRAASVRTANVPGAPSVELLLLRCCCCVCVIFVRPGRNACAGVRPRSGKGRNTCVRGVKKRPHPYLPHTASPLV
eukprot:5020343-Prymnesium_polylepis.2